MRKPLINRYRLLQRHTPEWANKGYLDLWYKLAKIEEERTGCKVHVDHIIPLRGEKVSGLHVEGNLQLMFAEDNYFKNNKTGSE